MNLVPPHKTDKNKCRLFHLDSEVMGCSQGSMAHNCSEILPYHVSSPIHVIFMVVFSVKRDSSVPTELILLMKSEILQSDKGKIQMTSACI